MLSWTPISFCIDCPVMRSGRVAPTSCSERGGVVSVQVLNEFAAVARRKLRLNIPEIRDVLDIVRSLCEVVPLELGTHDRALDLAERYKFSIYDALIVAAAIRADCTTLWTEDLHHGQKIERLTIRNPFIR